MSENAGPGLAKLRSKDFVTGLLFAAIGAWFAFAGADYGIGTARRMGPGYFPVMIGGALFLVGLGLILKTAFARRAGEATPRLHLWPLFFLTASVVAFGLTINRFGLVAACISCVLLAGAAGRSTRWPETIAVAIGMTIFSGLVFIELLGLPMRLWRWQ